MRMAELSYLLPSEGFGMLLSTRLLRVSSSFELLGTLPQGRGLCSAIISQCATHDSKHSLGASLPLCDTPRYY